MAEDVHLDYIAIDAMLNGPPGVGLVAPMLVDLAERAAVVAREKVHTYPHGRDPAREVAITDWYVRKGVSTAVLPSGTTRLSIHAHLGWVNGHIYSSTNALATPAIFLESPAEQMTDEYPFLTTGLWSLEGTV